jgi:hypothetical protein
MEMVEQQGSTVDEVLRDLLDHEESTEAAETETPAPKLMRLIDETELPFENPFNARDAEEILRNETGQITWRDADDDVRLRSTLA